MKCPIYGAEGVQGQSSLARGTWIEMLLSGDVGLGLESSLARGTWIEIGGQGGRGAHGCVVPRKRDVD